MARTISIDNLQITQLRLERDSQGQFHVYAEYHLKSGSQVVQGKYEEITSRLSSQRRTSALALLDGITADLTVELA
jgi:hypothetical protein